MSPQERQSLMLLEPELRLIQLTDVATRRALPPWLQRTMLFLRAYIIVTVTVVIVVLARGVH
jgi:uncharacterized membrane protein SirB2